MVRRVVVGHDKQGKPVALVTVPRCQRCPAPGSNAVPNLRVTTEFPVAATGRAYNSEPIWWLAGLNVKLLEIYLRRLEPPDLSAETTAEATDSPHT